MMLVAHGATLALAWFLALNLAASAAVMATARLVTARSDPRPPAFWLALRLLPAAAAAAFVLFFFIPSYWRYEPRELVEGFDVSLTALAIGAAAVLACAGARGMHAWLGAVRRTRQWMQGARPLRLAGDRVPAFEFDAEQPMMALVGVLRPRLLVTRGLIDALTPAELEAAVAHELGHRRAFDNLKRLAMRASPDFLIRTSSARAIERRWASAAEHVADRHGAPDEAARCALASALVKVARLTPPTTPAAEPISTLIAGGEIASRVRHLLDDSGAAQAGPSRLLRRLVVASACAAALAATYTPVLRAVHVATEIIVYTLP